MNRIKARFMYFREYGLKCTAVAFLAGIFSFLKPESKPGSIIYKIKHKVFLGYLNRHYYTDCENKTMPKGPEENRYHQCIWTAWLQGEEKAPEVIKLTIRSMRKFAQDHRVIVITHDNIENYISLPSVIRQKYTEGFIGNAHYADIIRMMILAKYGGIWLDATVLLHEPFEETVFSSLFFSTATDPGGRRSMKYVSDHRWIVGIIGGNEGSPYLSVISKMLVSFWQEHNIPIDYFVFDYLIAVLYQNDKGFRSTVDSLGKQRKSPYALKSVINEPFDESVFGEMMASHGVYILPYRNEYRRTTAEGYKTYYEYLCRQYSFVPDELNDRS